LAEPTLLLQQALESRGDSTLIPEDPTQRSLQTLWKDYRSLIYETHPDLLEPQAQRHTLRTIRGLKEFSPEPVKLPFFPSTLAAIQACEEAIAEPVSKLGLPQDPLAVGDFLRTQRTFLQKYWDTEGESQLAVP